MVRNDVDKITMVPIKDLKPFKLNRKSHPKDQVARLAELIAHHGFRDPPIVDNQTMEVIAGNGTLLAAKLLKMTEVPCILQTFESDEARYTFSVSHNAIQSWSEIDLSAIHKDLESLAPFNIDMLGVKDFQFEPTIDVEGEDEAPAVPTEAKSELGDLWILGEHRLMCGDSTNIGQVEMLMDGQKADMVFTDPPYGMKLDADYSKMPNSPTGARPKKWGNIIGDHEDFKPELIQTIFGIFDYCSEIVICGADYFAELLPNKNGGSWFVWDKRVTENFDRMIGSAFELMWSRKKHKREIARINNTLYSGESDAINKVHPTQKPIKLIEWVFERILGNNVVDLFGGSGSTLIACEKTKRKCFMMELDPKYVDVILGRWAKFTGKDPIRDDGTKWSTLSKTHLA